MPFQRYGQLKKYLLQFRYISFSYHLVIFGFISNEQKHNFIQSKVTKYFSNATINVLLKTKYM